MSLSDEVLCMVHAFSDVDRRKAVRELAARVKATETELITNASIRYDAVQTLLKIVWLYSGHKVDSRGPIGLLLDAITILEPQTAQLIHEGIDWADLIEES